MGGYCYPSVPDPSACRKVQALLKVGNYIYVGGVIDQVMDPSGTKTTVGGYYNLFRFNASTHKLDTTFKPQFTQPGGGYRDSAVTGLASDGTTLYVAGSFTNVSDGPGVASIQRKGVAAIDLATGKVKTTFNASIGSGGGPAIVNDVEYVKGTLWLGGNFKNLGGHSQAALASVLPATGAYTSNITENFSGVVTATAPLKVHEMAIDPSQTHAAVIGNFAQVNGVTHKEVVILNVAANGGSTSVYGWNAPTYLEGSQTNCSQRDTWARGVDWDPTGTHFDIAASGGGGFNPYPGLCDAFTRFKLVQTTNAVPEIVNYTGYDSLFAVCDTGNYAYLGGHNKHLDHALYIDGKKVSTPEQTNYGISVVDVNRGSSSFGHVVPAWNEGTDTGRGAGWTACLAVAGGTAAGGGVYVGGDAQKVNGDALIQRLAYFPG